MYQTDFVLIEDHHLNGFVRFTLIVLLLAFMGVIGLNAWLSDDAYITFRTIYNWLHGYGLTWNVSERVQTYTHPLWMFVMAGAYAVTHEVFFTSQVLSIFLSVMAVVLLVLPGRRDPLLGLICVVTLMLSKAFVDFSTSGLENPLTHLLLALLLIVYPRSPASSRRTVLVGLLTALGMLNRLDAGLLFGPALLWTVVRSDRPRSWWSAAISLVPLLGWELFALFYYGSWVPNTALAKLNIGLIRSSEIWREGVFYLYNSLRVDPITLVATGVAAVLVVAMRASEAMPLVAGSILYLFYVVWIGGDFMSGRFLTAPLFLALGALNVAGWPRAGLRSTSWRVVLLLLLAVLGLSAPYNPIRAWGGRRADQDPRIWIRGRSITDERANYYGSTGLLEALRQGRDMPDHDWARAGMEAREKGPHVTVQGSVGFFGYYAGPEVHVVDLLALGDPLLARLPVTDPNWQIGHFGRRPPEGYLATLRFGRNQITDPDLAQYYEKLALVVRGDLWDPARWRTLWAFNRGAYDDLLNSYAYRSGSAMVQSFTVTNVTGWPCVYTYVWNGEAGETYVLDTASVKGQRYSVKWRMDPSGTWLDTPYEGQLSEMPALSDQALLAVGVFFARDERLELLDMYERRYWFQLSSAGGVMTVLYPPLSWHNAAGPGGYWEERDISAVMDLESLTMVR